MARLGSIVVSLAALALAGCPGSHGLGADAGPATDSDLVRDCYGDPTVGAACDFATPCRRISDDWMGYCGTETWTCVEGRVVYDDARFRCAWDAGIGPDARAAWCESYEEPPGTGVNDCRSSADCEGGSCWSPGDTSYLYATGFCPADCTVDGDCADGEICQPLNGGSCAQCIPSCTPSRCGRWERCGDDGHCMPAPCYDGSYTCPPGSSCGLSGTPADSHGCSIVACASDADCGCGACVLGACAAGPGTCDLPRP